MGAHKFKPWRSPVSGISGLRKRMPTLTRRQQSNDFAIFRRQTTLMAVLVLQVATSFSPASVLNKQYTQGGVVVHVAELGENLPYTTPVWRASSLVKAGLPLTVYTSPQAWYGLVKPATPAAGICAAKCAFASDASSTKNYMANCNVSKDQYGCRGQCEPHLSAKVWVSRYMNTTGDPWNGTDTSCFGLPCGFTCTEHKDSYMTSAIKQELELYAYLFNNTNANKTGFALGSEIDALSRGAWNEVQVWWGDNITAVFYVDAPGTNITVNQQAGAALARTTRLPLVRLSLGHESIFPLRFESLYSWWKTRNQPRTPFRDEPATNWI